MQTGIPVSRSHVWLKLPMLVFQEHRFSGIANDVGTIRTDSGRTIYINPDTKSQPQCDLHMLSHLFLYTSSML